MAMPWRGEGNPLPALAVPAPAEPSGYRVPASSGYWHGSW